MLKYIKKFLQPVSVIAILLGLSLLSGCTLKSGPKVFAKTTPTPAKPAPGASQRLARAFDTTSRDGRKFYFSGWQVTKIQKRNTQLIINGSYDKGKGYVLDAQVFGEPFRYYRWSDEVYLSEGDKWRKAAPTDKPLEPFTDFAKLLFLTDNAVKLPDEVLLSKNCDVYEIALKPSEIAAAAGAMGIHLPNDSQAADYYFNKVNMKIIIWVGKQDNFIYQYKSMTNMPVPDAGSMYQEIFYKFWSYNSSAVNVPAPDKIAPYLVKD